MVEITAYAYTRAFTSGRGKLLFLLPRKKLDRVDLVGQYDKRAPSKTDPGSTGFVTREIGRSPVNNLLLRWIVSVSYIVGVFKPFVFSIHAFFSLLSSPSFHFYYLVNVTVSESPPGRAYRKSRGFYAIETNLPASISSSC